MIKDQFSIILRTKNEERWIGHTIQSVIDNFYKPEILIIDNNSNDRTIEIARNFKSNPNFSNNEYSNYCEININDIEDYTPGKALNKGVELAKYNNLMIISSHCVIKDINLDSVIENLKKFSAVFGKQIPVIDGKRITRRYIWDHFGDKKVENMFSSMENRYFLHNAFSFYKKETLLKYKFDENLSGKEDRYWAIEIRKKNMNFLYDPSHSVYHHYTPDGNTWKGIG